MWSFIGTLYLIYLTYQDYNNKMMVDDRKNFFMMGLTMGLLSLYARNLLYIVFLVGFVVLLTFVFSKYKVMGRADIKTFMWSFFGFGILGVNILIFYLVCFIFVNTFFYFLKVKFFKYYNPVPYYAVFLISFVLTCAIQNLY